MRQQKWKEIAHWLEVNPPYLSRVINRKMLPSPSKAAELKEVSGISVEDWLYLEKDAIRKKILLAYASVGKVVTNENPIVNDNRKSQPNNFQHRDPTGESIYAKLK